MHNPMSGLREINKYKVRLNNQTNVPNGEELKANKNFKCIPVVILSTSNSHFDVLFSYDNGASLFLTKPHSFHDLVEMLDLLLSLSSKYISFPEA